VSEEKEERKYCPLPSSEAGVVVAYCTREKCGWWNPDTQTCGIAALGNLPLIVEELNHIVIRLGEGR